MIEAKLPVAFLNDGRRRMLFAFYLLFVAVYTLAFAYIMARGDSPYLIGDWLINYSGGFVRRGLMGAVVLPIGHATNIPLAGIVFIIQTSAFLLFLACVYHLSKGIRWSYLMTAVLLSPATIAFTVLDSGAGIRKEVLLYAGLALAICAIVPGRLRNWQMSVLLSVIVVVLTLSHETLVVGMPYLFAALVIQRGGARPALKICIAPLLLGCAALIAVMLHPGNFAVAQAICSSVGGKMAPVTTPKAGICAGSIAWLQYNLPQARAGILPIIRGSHMVRRMILLAIPTFVPLIAQLVLFWRRDHLGREVSTVAWCGLVSFVGTGFLFYSSLDWGRWLHMQAICLMLMVLMIDRRAAHQPMQAVSTVQGTRVWRLAAALAVFLYATTWTLPSIGAGHLWHGYIDNARLLRHWVSAPPAHPWGV